MGNEKWRKSKKKLKNWLIFKFIQALISVFNQLGREKALNLGKNLGRLSYYLIGDARKKSLKNLKIAFPQKREKELKKIAQETFENLGKNTVEFANLRNEKEKIKKIIKVENIEEFDKAYQRKKGVVALTGHIGNFELLAAFFAFSGYKVSVIGRKLYDERLDKILIQQREKLGVKNIPSTAGPKRVLKALNCGDALGVLIDQDTSRVRGIFVNFFGKKAKTPVGPILLAIRTGSPIVPMAIVREKDSTHKIIITKAIETGKNNQGNVVKITQECTKRLEEIIREYPEQWVWMHERWKTQELKS
jgi:KDO2-lipid IV(A) lauroyltransferase